MPGPEPLPSKLALARDIILAMTDWEPELATPDLLECLSMAADILLALSTDPETARLLKHRTVR